MCERRSLVVLFDDHYKYLFQVNVIIAFRVPCDQLSLIVCDLIWIMMISMTFHGFHGNVPVALIYHCQLMSNLR